MKRDKQKLQLENNRSEDEIKGNTREYNFLIDLENDKKFQKMQCEIMELQQKREELIRALSIEKNVDNEK